MLFYEKLFPADPLQAEAMRIEILRKFKAAEDPTDDLLFFLHVTGYAKNSAFHAKRLP